MLISDRPATKTTVEVKTTVYDLKSNQIWELLIHAWDDWECTCISPDGKFVAGHFYVDEAPKPAWLLFMLRLLGVSISVDRRGEAGILLYDTKRGQKAAFFPAAAFPSFSADGKTLALLKAQRQYRTLEPAIEIQRPLLAFNCYCRRRDRFSLSSICHTQGLVHQAIQCGYHPQRPIDPHIDECIRNLPCPTHHLQTHPSPAEVWWSF